MKKAKLNKMKKKVRLIWKKAKPNKPKSLKPKKLKRRVKKNKPMKK